jgi:hypothetical protein
MTHIIHAVRGHVILADDADSHLLSQYSWYVIRAELAEAYLALVETQDLGHCDTAALERARAAVRVSGHHSPDHQGEAPDV